MSTDYEEFYKDNPHGLGEPFFEFVDFFESYKLKNARVLDLGAGQGRDTLLIARKGHDVTAVDISKTGIAQILNDAKKEKLNIKGVVKDIRTFIPNETYDVVVIDRTLHMIKSEKERISVLARIINSINPSGYILIADERKNLPSMKELFDNKNYEIVMHNKGFLFIQKVK